MSEVPLYNVGLLLLWLRLLLLLHRLLLSGQASEVVGKFAPEKKATVAFRVYLIWSVLCLLDLV